MAFFFFGHIDLHVVWYLCVCVCGGGGGREEDGDERQTSE